jgi:serine phosphatase RsbU (regulator of sigma subunit)
VPTSDPLVRTGLDAASDPMYDRFAVMVRHVMNVPTALVSLVDHTRQVFPGASGLPDPWQQSRQAPLSHSLCRPGVTEVVSDAGGDPRLAGNPAVADFSVGSLAGAPLTDADGRVLGSLCAVDNRPRHWTEAELGLLADLAAACADSLRLRIVTQAAHRREDTARVRERAVGAAFDRSQLLLRASVALASTTTVSDVVDAVRELVTGTMNPAYVGVSLIESAGQVTLRSGGFLPMAVADRWRTYPDTARTPSAVAARTGIPVLLPDRDAVVAQAPDAVATFDEMGWQAAASVPLPGPAGPIGALTFVWKQHYALSDAEQAALAALAGYVAQALQRADYLYSREQVAALLQQAMLSDLPDVTPFELAARYEPAARGEHVGGDWYDAVRLNGDCLALVVGDVTGHDMHAAARMGQLRSMLRAFVTDRDEPPSALLRRLDNAMQVLGDRVPATAVLAYIRPDGDGHLLQWANAGHPAPMLIEPGGLVRPLSGRDMLLGVQPSTPRTTFGCALPPGATVLFYTDGLIETRVDLIDDRKEKLRQVLTGLADAPLDELLDLVLARIAGDSHEDDAVLLALRTPGR